MDNTARRDELDAAAMHGREAALPVIVIASGNFGASVTAYAKGRADLHETAASAEMALARLALRGDFVIKGPAAAGASAFELGAKLLASARERTAPFQVEFCAADELA